MRRIRGCQSPRKRQRLSSPTYDDQVGDLSEQDIRAFDQFDAGFDAGLSQGSQSPGTNAYSISQKYLDKRKTAITEAPSQKENSPTMNALNSLAPLGDLFLPFDSPRDDPDNPFTPNLQAFTSAKFLTTTASNSSADFGQPHPPSPELPLEQDYSSWFEPETIVSAKVGFFTAKFASPSAMPGTNTAAPTAGFMTASKKGWIAPSVAALAKAEEKMKDIWREEEQELVASSSIPDFNPPSPLRKALRPVENSLPVSPSPAGFRRPSTDTNTPSVSTSPEFDQLTTRHKPKPFKSPLINSASPSSKSKSFHPLTGFASSPLNPNRPPHTFISAGSQHPLAAITSTPLLGSAYSLTGSTSFVTPARPLGIVPRGGVRDSPARFVTPFKVGLKHGEPHHIRLDQEKAMKSTTAGASGHSSMTREGRQVPGEVQLKARERWKAFDLTKPANRMSLASSGLVPQSYSSDELENMGVNIAELRQVTPTLALYYSFHTSSTIPLSTNSALPSPTPNILGPSTALAQLLERGCVLTTKPWVDNHWSLILWKLAGMVSLDPNREKDPSTKVWCWTEVMRQLLYRYERELNGGTRPPLRLVATHDAPASCPMVLCVSNVTWSGAGVTEDGLPIEPYPELEVTDGWYRLRAQVDQPLARAVRKGVIRAGRKIAVAGARLSSERKDPTEILEAYNSVRLVLSGNSSHLAAWHTKLGFQMGTSMATLNSLTPDGGLVAAMDVVVIKAYPLAFIEFIEDEAGNKHREGPRNENEEAGVHKLWKRKRDMEESKLRVELEKKLSRYEGYVERLEHRAGTRFNPGEDDYPPDYIDNLYDGLEEPSEAGALFARLSCDEAGWLARFIRDRIDKDRDRAGEEVEQELKNICPPREVRNFRVVVVEDACTQRRPSHRNAQLTVWDALSMSLSEGGKAGAFESGQRFRVTNLIPTQQNSWMDCEPGSEVFLSTRRDSRWTRIK